jgi:hypothetical protein
MPISRPRLQWLIVCGLIPLIVACSAPRLDSSNLKRSAVKVRRSLDEADRERFDEALALVGEVQKGRVAGTEKVEVDGMTGIELLAEAERIGLRREVAWVEEKMAFHQGVLSEGERLASLRVEEIGIVEPGDGSVRVRMKLNNQTGEILGSGFVRLKLDMKQGRELKTEEFVTFRPALRPGETRDVQTGVSRGFSRTMFSTPGAHLTVEFTSLERGGEVLATQPSPVLLKESRAALEEAEQELADLTQQLQAIQ